MYQFGPWQLRWLGHDGFQLTNDQKTIYIDPYKVIGSRPADYILLTHAHSDHLDLESIAKLRQINTVFVGPAAVTDQLDEMAITLGPGQSQAWPELNLIATTAYNTNKDFHPKADHLIGFILELDGKRLYHAGDTDLITEMAELGLIDIALLPVSGKYVMTADEAIAAAKVIKPKVAIPMHYGAIVGSLADAERFKLGLADVCEVVVLNLESAG